MSIYIDTVWTAIIFFPFVALIISLPFFIWAYRKYGSFTLTRALILYSFSYYLLTIYFLVILPLPTFSEAAALAKPMVDLNPASFIIYILKDRSIQSVLEPCFNILVMVPLGIYLRYYFQYSLKKTILLTFFLSLFFEITQLTGLYGIYPQPYRLFSVNDLMFNTLGGIIGYGIAPLLMKLLPSKDHIDKKSFIKGETVSLFRRGVAFIIDLIILVILSGLISYGLDALGVETKGIGRDGFGIVVYTIVIFLYFMIICRLAGGKTAGKAVVSIKVVRTGKEDQPPSLWSLIKRYVLLYFVFVPVVYVLLYLLELTGTATGSTLNFILQEIVAICAICVLLAINFIYAFFSSKHRLIHETLSGTQVISTIKNPQEKSD